MGTARAKTREAREGGDPSPSGILLWIPGSAFTNLNPWRALKEVSTPLSPGLHLHLLPPFSQDIAIGIQPEAPQATPACVLSPILGLLLSPHSSLTAWPWPLALLPSPLSFHVSLPFQRPALPWLLPNLPSESYSFPISCPMFPSDCGKFFGNSSSRVRNASLCSVPSERAGHPQPPTLELPSVPSLQ